MKIKLGESYNYIKHTNINKKSAVGRIDNKIHTNDNIKSPRKPRTHLEAGTRTVCIDKSQQMKGLFSSTLENSSNM